MAEVLAAGLRAKELVRQILTFSRQTEIQWQPIRIKTIGIDLILMKPVIREDLGQALRKVLD